MTRLSRDLLRQQREQDNAAIAEGRSSLGEFQRGTYVRQSGSSNLYRNASGLYRASNINQNIQQGTVADAFLGEQADSVPPPRRIPFPERRRVFFRTGGFVFMTADYLVESVSYILPVDDDQTVIWKDIQDNGATDDGIRDYLDDVINQGSFDGDLPGNILSMSGAPNDFVNGGTLPPLITDPLVQNVEFSAVTCKYTDSNVQFQFPSSIFAIGHDYFFGFYSLPEGNTLLQQFPPITYRMKIESAGNTTVKFRVEWRTTFQDPNLFSDQTVELEWYKEGDEANAVSVPVEKELTGDLPPLAVFFWKTVAPFEITVDSPGNIIFRLTSDSVMIGSPSDLGAGRLRGLFSIDQIELEDGTIVDINWAP